MIALERILPRAQVQYATRNALHSHGRWLTFADLAPRVFRLAGAFLAKGALPGDRIAILDFNSPEYIEAYYASAHIGSVSVALNSRLSVPELEYILRDCSPRILVVGPSHREQLEQLQQRNVVPAITIVVGSTVPGTVNYHHLIQMSELIDRPRASKPDEIASIYYTSGTTGEPKGVCLTHANMIASALDAIVGLSLGRDDVWLHAAPLFHLVDAWAVWAMPLLGAAQATTHFTPEAFIDACHAAEVTQTALPPTLINLLCEQARPKLASLKALKQIMYGGSPMLPSVLEKAQGLIPARLLNSYGATELSGTMTLVQDARQGSQGSAGVPVVSAIVEVVDAAAEPVRSGEAGEIVVSGPRVMAGYWNKPNATRDAIVGGRYHTGDIGYFDETGNLYVADRKKDMIITGGENVYSVEVEAIISAHPAVLECAVIGIFHERWVEAVHAVVVTAPEHDVTAEDLISFCRGKIAAYKIPKSIDVFRSRLPRSATGKVLKHEIRSWYAQDARRRD